jgi:hypothetical protein
MLVVLVSPLLDPPQLNEVLPRVMHDEKVLRLQEEDDNCMGDGGTSDAEDEGYDIVEGFRDNMKAAHKDRLMNG